VDLYKTIRELLEERKRLDAIIARLEKMQAVESVKTQERPGKRRGRKNMGDEERRQVSERMRRYWEARRVTKGAAAAAGAGDDPSPSV
jgi:hypothetical protein